jgi:dihydroneopterin aldolase
MKGKCVVRGMIFHAFHGTMEVERELGQVFSVDVELGLNLAESDVSPSVKSLVRGLDVYEVTKNIMMGTKFMSHTSLALAIGKEMLGTFKSVTNVSVRVGCRQIFIAGDVREVLSEVECSRDDFKG